MKRESIWRGAESSRGGANKERGEGRFHVVNTALGSDMTWKAATFVATASHFATDVAAVDTSSRTAKITIGAKKVSRSFIAYLHGCCGWVCLLFFPSLSSQVKQGHRPLGASVQKTSTATTSK